MTKVELRKFLLNNKDATKIELIGENIKELPPELGELKNLRILILHDNKIKSLPPEIFDLFNLEILNLADNNINALPSKICNLINLKKLNLEANQLKSLPSEIGNLSNLKSLYLSLNHLTDLPQEIGELVNLEELYIRDNKLKILPGTIGKLKNIREFYLWDNQLKTLPEEICELGKLSRLELKGNPLETPPLEIAIEGIKAIQHYFRQLEKEGEDKIYEAKLLIIGEPGAGKTSLAKKILNPHYKLFEFQETTRGIDVFIWNFISSEGRDFRVNIWDFGGQEIYHSTHQFFLTKRSLYTLVADTRKEDTDFYYWLNVVELLSDNSPLLIVLNEKQDRHKEIGERQLRGQFSNLKETLKTNLADNRGLDRIIEEIKHQLAMLPHVGSTLPKTWVRVRQALENDSRNYIDVQEYFYLCQRNGCVEEEDKLQLSDYIHNVGKCLHFKDDPILKKTVILKPEWGTTAVYKVLDNPRVIANMGHFCRVDLAEIWKETEYTDRRDELLQLMIKFKLCYEIPGSSGNYIAPQCFGQPAKLYLE